MLWLRGLLGLERPQSVNTEPGRPVGGTALEPSCWLPQGSASEVGSCSLRGTPVGLNRQAPEDRRRPGLGPVLSGSPSWLLAPGWLDRWAAPRGRTGTVGGGGRRLQKLIASLGSCGLFPGGDRLEPRRQHDPHPQPWS